MKRLDKMKSLVLPRASRLSSELELLRSRKTGVVEEAHRVVLRHEGRV